MVCYLIRHGKDDETIRGGWSHHGLVPDGIAQVQHLAQELVQQKLDVKCIYSSDLQRAQESADILAGALHLPVYYSSEFREINNGDLAGIPNDLANEKYPGFYYASLSYDECYPNGESPNQFFSRIHDAWTNFKKEVEHDSILVTHGGVIEAILCIENHIKYTNTQKHFSTPHAKVITLNLAK